jgi:hypothetical protein
MTKSLEELIEKARFIPVSREDHVEQRRSFAYGNTAIENPNITREMVENVEHLLSEVSE